MLANRVLGRSRSVASPGYAGTCSYEKAGMPHRSIACSTVIAQFSWSHFWRTPRICPASSRSSGGLAQLRAGEREHHHAPPAHTRRRRFCATANRRLDVHAEPNCAEGTGPRATNG